MKRAEEFFEWLPEHVDERIHTKKDILLAIRAAQIDALEWAAQCTLGAISKLDNQSYQQILRMIVELQGEK